jgi:hypothetical protein
MVLQGWITTYDVTVTVPAGATTGTVSVPTTADTIDEVDETFSINGTVSATGTIIDNNAPTGGNDHSASATEGSDVVFDFTLATLLQWILRILCSWYVGWITRLLT